MRGMMSSGIFLIQNDELTELSVSPFESEDIFQELLSKHPSLIAGDQIDSDRPRRWLLIRREMGVPGEEDGADRWSLDHLFLDQDGVPTLVEVKRSTDTRLRREVVGQMLDYAANATVYWPAETIQSQFRLRCEHDELDADEVLADFLGEDAEPQSFWASVKTNLQAGKIRMLFIADEVPKELRRIVEFLNAQMDPAEVLAVEIRRYGGAEQEMLVSRVIGQTAEAELKKAGNRPPSRKWDEASFFAAVDAEDDDQLKQTISAIYKWAKGSGSRISWGRGAKTGTFRISAQSEQPNIFYVFHTGSLSFNPVALRKLPPFDRPDAVKELATRLESVGHLSKSKQSSWDHTWVAYQLQDLEENTGLKQLLSVLDWLVKQLNKE